MPLSKYSRVINTIDVSNEEKAQAIQTRKAFEEMLNTMETAFTHLDLLNGALSGITDTAPLEGLRKLFRQYRRRIQTLFNDFIDKLQVALDNAHQTVSDSEMERIQDTIVAEVREIRDGVERLLGFLKEPQDPRFIDNFTSTVDRLKIRQSSLDDVVSESLFSHLDADVLGKIRLG